MPNLDNHMDELFQNAAENYPLKTNTGNFDDLMPFIGGETTTTAAKPALSKGKRKTALFLLAFLVSGFTIATIYLITKNNINKTINNKVSVKDKSTPEVNKNIAAPFTAEAQSENTLSSSTAIYKKNKLVSHFKGNMLTKITSAVADKDEDSEKLNNQPGSFKTTDNPSSTKIKNEKQAKSVIVTAEEKKVNTDKTDERNELTSIETKTTDKKNKSRNKPGLYYGIAAGIELNQVNGQPTAKAGLNGTVILGLQINPKISIETGVQVSQKKYYSDGKYFKPKAGSMPANMTVNSLQSSNTIIEIPVSVKYNLSKKKNTLYAKAGVSSYIMTKESNKYQAVVSGQQQEVNSTYKSNQGYLASDIRISAGYQHTAGKKLIIRIEPYIQIPLKGIGIGVLPVTSAGIQLVLTRNR